MTLEINNNNNNHFSKDLEEKINQPITINKICSNTVVRYAAAGVFWGFFISGFDANVIVTKATAAATYCLVNESIRFTIQEAVPSCEDTIIEDILAIAGGIFVVNKYNDPVFTFASALGYKLGAAFMR
ncbi:MAG: hypothetical protein CMO81_09965 [Waddliaceae bacterium]|nr:hypothetical protein [Waddliaceae bacterium]